MKCPHCPQIGPCRGESIPRLCQLVDPSRADHNPAYLRALGAQPKAAPVVPLAESARLTRLVKECPHRTVQTDLGCGCSECALGKGRDGVVNQQECWECVRDTAI